MSYPQHVIGMSKWDLDTPALLLDIGLAEQNLATMAAAAQRFGKNLRPHVKTHKTPLLARRQVEAGAIGVSAAKLGEVEALILGGVKEILLTTETVGLRAGAEGSPVPGIQSGRKLGLALYADRVLPTCNQDGRGLPAWTHKASAPRSQTPDMSNARLACHSPSM